MLFQLYLLPLQSCCEGVVEDEAFESFDVSRKMTAQRHNKIITHHNTYTQGEITQFNILREITKFNILREITQFNILREITQFDTFIPTHIYAP